MKLFSSVLILVSALSNYSFSQEQQVYPPPFYHLNINGVYFTDNNTGYVTTNNNIFKTTDDGQNWTSIFYSTEYSGLKKILFINDDTGFVMVGKLSTILRTTNRGNNWQSIFIELGGIFETYYFEGLFFIDNSTGYIVGGNPDFMAAKKTINGGTNWTNVLFTPSFFHRYRDVWFLDSLKGFIAGDESLLRTTNGGQSWTNVSIPPYTYFNTIMFVNQSLGYASNNRSGVYRTLDGGATWLQIVIPGIECCRTRVFSTSPFGVYVVDTELNIFKSSNQGGTWINQLSPQISGYDDFEIPGLHFSNDSKGYAYGSGGIILRTTNFGNVWSNATDRNNFRTIKANQGKIVSAGENGTFYLSNDFGKNWLKINNDNSFKINSINTDTSKKFFIAAGDSGYIVRSDTSGLEWEKIDLNTNENLNKVVTTRSSVMVVSENKLFYSSDNGNKWNDISGNNFSGIRFRGAYETNNIFYRAGDSGTVAKSTDFGKSWIKLEFPKSFSLNEIYFIDSNTGFIAGKKAYSAPDVNFYKTTNTGITWDSVTAQPWFPEVNFNRINFLNNYTGFITGNDCVYRTTDNGNTWYTRFFEGKIDFDFLNIDTAFMCGNYGGIYRTTNAGNWIISGIDPIAQTIPSDHALFNYPNPFNPITKINFDLPKEGKVKLIVYDLLGKEILKLVNNEFRSAGRHLVEFNGNNLTSGVYFYRLEVNDFVQTRRMILIK